jgi:hypothetical protein
MAVSSVGLRLKCDCSGKAQKQFNSKLETRSLVREDAVKAEQRRCPTKDEPDKIWSRVPKGGPIPRLTGRLTVGRKTNSNSNSRLGSLRWDCNIWLWVLHDSNQWVIALQITDPSSRQRGRLTWRRKKVIVKQRKLKSYHGPQREPYAGWP